MNQKQAAEKLGISDALYSQVKSGKRGFSIYVLTEIKKATGITIDTILAMDREKIFALLEGR